MFGFQIPSICSLFLHLFVAKYGQIETDLKRYSCGLVSQGYGPRMHPWRSAESDSGQTGGLISIPCFGLSARL